MNPTSDLLPGVPLVESPLFEQSVKESGFTEQELEAAKSLHENGYAVIDFPDPQIHERIERIKRNLAPRFDVDLTNADAIKNEGLVLRVQDAWTYDEDVRAIAGNASILDLLSRLYGRKAFPFQTLNFPVGTQQHLHSDSIHFSSIPERFMCGVWLAMEDVSPDAGPLTYLPGSHAWPILKNYEIGRVGWGSQLASAQEPFEQVWELLVANSSRPAENFTPRQGQALIWAANLLHGGSVQKDPRLTRWSQVTHYYFDDCIYYTPAFSDEPLGKLDLRTITDVVTGSVKPNLYLGQPVLPHDQPTTPRKKWRPWKKRPSNQLKMLPVDFDEEAYLLLNPDVRNAGIDPKRHYLENGFKERRRFKR